jgi:nitroreductase
MNTDFSTLSNIIKSRRTTKPSLMNGKKIPDEQVHALLALADWAPTHAYSEPWRFIVFAGEQVNQFSKQHALLYQQFTPADKFLQSKFDSIIANGDKASHLIVCYMKRSNEKLPVMEELAAVSCAVQHILLGATALGIASIWSTGGMVLHQAMKNYLELANADEIVGQLYLGYSDEVIDGKRKIALQEKVSWR